MRINIELPEELHTALKVRAAVEGITLKQLIINILKTDL
jgi:predicted DNA binding CopG/RHH family protein|tara:strand:+ start:171 stop:287 length:117 start_codon:yes stop_codon:yes gene_type:complete